MHASFVRKRISKVKYVALCLTREIDFNTACQLVAHTLNATVIVRYPVPNLILL
jgi:hypothetical protein